MNPITWILASVFLGVVGQLILKTGLNRIGPLALGRQGLVGAGLRIGTSPAIWAGLGLYAIGTFFWLAALSQVELGYAYPFISLSYVFILVASWAFFGEEMSLWRVFGVVAVCLGVIIVASG